MDDQQLLRYSRHILLPQIDTVGQERLLRAKVLVVGLGGLGSPVAMYLAASGVGTLVLNDFDLVDLGNLQRQIVHQTFAIGLNKTASARQTLQALNPDCVVKEISWQLDRAALMQQVLQVDAVVDCSDNFMTRRLLNEVCYQARKPLISGAAIRFEGQVTVFHHQRAEDACYACLYPEGDDDDSCSANGVLSPVVGVIGSLQAVETLKLIAAVGDTLRNRLLIYDGFIQEVRTVKYHRDPQCPVCGQS